MQQPLVALAAIADVGIGLPYLLARVLSARRRPVLAVTYEYGNTFVIVAGLLNLLVACDAWDHRRRPEVDLPCRHTWAC